MKSFLSFFKNEVTLLIIGLGVPLLLLWLRVHVKCGLPSLDDNDYLQTCLNIISQAGYHGLNLAAWIHNAYTIRGWRPVLFPALATPLFGIFSFLSLVSLLRLYSMLLVFLTLFYLHKFLRNFLRPVEVCLILILVGTLPWFNNSMSQFMCEPIFVLTSFVAVYYLYRAQFFSIPGYSFLAGIFIGLSFAIRPVEGILILMPAAVIYIYYCIQEKKLPVSALLGTVPCLVTLALSLKYCFKLYPDEASHSMRMFMTVLTLAMAFLTWPLSLIWRSWRGWLSFFVPAFGIPVLWCLPLFQAIWSWVRFNAFCPPVDSIYRFKQGQGFVYILGHIIGTAYFSYSMLALLILGILSVGIWGIRHYKRKYFSSGMYWITGVIGTFLFHPFIAQFANDNIDRVYQTQALVLTIALLVAIFKLQDIRSFIYKAGVVILIGTAIFHYCVTLAECRYFGSKGEGWFWQSAKNVSPQVNCGWVAVEDNWYEQDLYGQISLRLADPRINIHGKMLGIVKPYNLHAKRLALRLAKAGRMIDVELSADRWNSSSKDQCFNIPADCSYNWIIAGPLDSIDATAADPSFMSLVNRFKNTFHPTPIVVKKNGQTVVFLFKWIGYHHK